MRPAKIISCFLSILGAKSWSNLIAQLILALGT